MVKTINIAILIKTKQNILF